jgi:hypothetical protein
MLLGVFLLLAAVWPGTSARPQMTMSSARCVVNIPPHWGTFRGVAQGYGLVFEDEEGTLRFTSQMPCGLEGAPNVSLEIRRK